MNIFSAAATNYLDYITKRDKDDFNKKDYFGRTAMYYAIAFQSFDVINFFMSNLIKCFEYKIYFFNLIPNF